jgi:hypothetical protein
MSDCVGDPDREAAREAKGRAMGQIAWMAAHPEEVARRRVREHLDRFWHRYWAQRDEAPGP